LRHLEHNPLVSHRHLIGYLRVRLGKANYRFQALVEKGLVKARN
jgi:hypothetical protein